jgi:hypothetical protein
VSAVTSVATSTCSHPHLHILVTDGGLAPNGTFYVLPKVSLSGLEQLFRHRVLNMFPFMTLNPRQTQREECARRRREPPLTARFLSCPYRSRLERARSVW